MTSTSVIFTKSCVPLAVHGLNAKAYSSSSSYTVFVSAEPFKRFTKQNEPGTDTSLHSMAPLVWAATCIPVKNDSLVMVSEPIPKVRKRSNSHKFLTTTWRLILFGRPRRCWGGRDRPVWRGLELYQRRLGKSLSTMSFDDSIGWSVEGLVQRKPARDADMWPGAFQLSKWNAASKFRFTD